MGLAVSTTDRLAVPFAADLARHGDRVALLTRTGEVTYRELADRVAGVVDRLGDGRKLVLVAAGNDLDSVVAYLAGLSAGHPVLVAAGDRPDGIEKLMSVYDPDVVVRGPVIEKRRSVAGHDLHRDLALLLTTSGSTGSAKVVRLSQASVQSNADAIGTYLELHDGDRAALSLPMHYCYGLSVINSHLARGASIVLSDRSVVDRCFWDQFRATGATSLAGVPHTFDLLDRIGFEHLSLPTLRCVTQAGGRLAPDRVRRYAELGRRKGFRFYVMYGQTEATARMAYLPPALAAARPGAIGRAVPGGSLRLEPLDEAAGHDLGELVYRGPNVMLGYAEKPSDLALGRVVEELHTGDIARQSPDGLYEIVGRRSRFVKLFGLRVDLDEIEGALAAAGITALCAGDDRRLVVAATPGSAARARRVIAGRIALPHSSVLIGEVDQLPRLANGKPDYPAVFQLGERAQWAATAVEPPEHTHNGDEDAGGSDESVARLFAELFPGADVGPDSTFVSLGGDSLSYVEASVRLEQLLGFLPPAWHTTPLRQLTPRPPRTRKVVNRVETNVVLRAAAITLVVATHAGLLTARGGAHLLLAIAGFNFARFQLSPARRRPGVGHLVQSLSRVAVPSICWIGVVMAATGTLRPTNLLLVNNYLGPRPGTGLWRYWYIEALVQLVVVLTALLAVPAVRRFEREHALGAAAALAGAGLVLGSGLVGLPDGTYPIFMPHNVLWIFALGWVAERAFRRWHRLALSAVIALAVPEFFAHADRDIVVLAGLLLLVWVPSLPVPWPLNRAVGLVAAASLAIYLVHPQVYRPVLAHYPPLVAVIAAVLAGVGVWIAARWLVGAARAGWATRPSISRRGPGRLAAGHP